MKHVKTISPYQPPIIRYSLFSQCYPIVLHFHLVSNMYISNIYLERLDGREMILLKSFQLNNPRDSYSRHLDLHQLKFNIFTVYINF